MAGLVERYGIDTEVAPILRRVKGRKKRNRPNKGPRDVAERVLCLKETHLKINANDVLSFEPFLLFDND